MHVPGQVLDAHGARSKIFAAAEERDEAWRKDQLSPCVCHGSDDVTMVAGGLSWDGRACLDHGFIVHGTSPIWGRDEDDGWPMSQRRRS